MDRCLGQTFAKGGVYPTGGEGVSAGVGGSSGFLSGFWEKCSPPVVRVGGWGQGGL